MTRFVRRYGASPLSLLALLASFALAGDAAVRLVSSRPIAVIVWFVGAAVGHDLLLVPLYTIADRSLVRLWRARPGPAGVAPWLNYVRIPAGISAVLLLVFLPSIARLAGGYHAITGLSSAGYLANWLAVTGVLFMLSAVVCAVQVRRKGGR